MRSSSLLLLSEDVLGAVLKHLCLRDLGRLATSCRALHAVVGKQPETLWRQAAQRDPGQRVHCLLPLVNRSQLTLPARRVSARGSAAPSALRARRSAPEVSRARQPGAGHPRTPRAAAS